MSNINYCKLSKSFQYSLIQFILLNIDIKKFKSILQHEHYMFFYFMISCTVHFSIGLFSIFLLGHCFKNNEVIRFSTTLYRLNPVWFQIDAGHYIIKDLVNICATTDGQSMSIRMCYNCITKKYSSRLNQNYFM